MRDLSLFTSENGQLTPVVVQAPGGGFNPEFNNMFAQNLGFGPPPPGAQAMPPPGGGYGGPQPGGYGGPQPNQPQHNLAAGQFDLGGGQQLRIKINGQSPENFAKNQVSSMVWGWIIGAAIVGLLLIGGIGLGIYIWATASSGSTAGGGVPTKTATVTQWDGKSPFTCGGNDAVALTGITATAGVTASGNCQLTLTNVNITAPNAVTANGNGKINMVGGSVNGATNAEMNGIVTFTGTKVTGAKNKKMNGKINGAP